MLASYRLLSERSRVRLAPGARSNSTTIAPRGAACVANQSAKRPIYALRFVGWAVVSLVLLVNVDPSAKESVARPAAADSARALVAEHQCSSSVQDPTHAVVTVDGVTRYVGQRLTDRAIEQAVFGIDHGLVVAAFCR